MRNAVLAGLLAAACQAGDSTPLEPLEIPEGCNPIGAGGDCLLPWPSDVFRAPDPARPGGFRVEHPEAALPLRSDGVAMNVLGNHPADGFGTTPQIMALFPGGVDPADLVGAPDDHATSLDPSTSPTLLIDADTGEAVLHFAELDPTATRDEQRALFVRPMEALVPGHRHIVAIRGLRDAAGQAVPAPEGFRRLRDGQTSVDPELESLADHYDSIFEDLETLGVAREELQLAWDFTVQSEGWIRGDMLTLRSRTLEWLDTVGTSVSVDLVEDLAGDTAVARKIQGRIEVPLFLTSDDAGASFSRDGSGQIVQNGTALVPFIALLPRAAVDAGETARAVQFGHGFFGLRQEIERDGVRKFLEQTQVAMFAVDLWGLSDPDQIFVVANLFGDSNALLDWTDRLHQTVVNQIVLTEVIRTHLPMHADFQPAGQPVLDGSAPYYYGVSLGGILGPAIMANNPWIEKGALSVGGGGFSFIVTRSTATAALIEQVNDAVPGELDRQKLLSMIQTPIDSMEPHVWSGQLLTDTIEPAPAVRQVLMQSGIGDTSVPSGATHIHARSLGLPQLGPANREIPGIPTGTGPLPSALVEFEFGVPEPLPDWIPDPPDEPTTVHGDVRRSDEGIAQLDAFFQPAGQVIATCEGPCDPQ